MPLLTSNSQSSCLGLSSSGIIVTHYHTQLTKISTFIVCVRVQVHMYVRMCGGLRTTAGVIFLKCSFETVPHLPIAAVLILWVVTPFGGQTTLSQESLKSLGKQILTL